MDDSNKEMYSLIGDLYFNSNCDSDNKLESRLKYLAAYKYYEKAGNTTSMISCENQFPSVEEMFLSNKNVGSQINTGCWINEIVVLKSR